MNKFLDKEFFIWINYMWDVGLKSITPLKSD